MILRGANWSFVPVFVLIVVLGGVSCSSTEERTLRKGNDLYDAGNYIEARLAYRAAVQRNPKLAGAYYKLGLTEEKLHDFRAAFQALNQAAALMPAREDVQAALGELSITGLTADPARPANLHETAVRISDELLAKNPKSVPALRIKGRLAMLDNRPEQAVGFFRRAQQQRADDADVTIHLVESLTLSGHEAEAEQTAREHIALRKGDGGVYDALSNYYLQRNRVSDAERVLKLKISNNPNEPVYVTDLARFYSRIGRRDQALNTVAGMLSKPARPTAAHLAAGDFYGSIGLSEQAVQQFEEGMRSARDQEVLFQKRLLALAVDQKNDERAASLADQVLSERPQDDEALAVRARLRAESGKPAALAAAIEDYKILLRRNSRDPNVHYRFARALQQNGDIISAKVEFQEALNLEPSFLAAEIGLAEIAVDQHKPEEAIPWTNKVLAADPANTQARLLKAMALLAAGKRSEGRAELEQLTQNGSENKSAYLQQALLEIEEKNFQKAVIAFEKLQRLNGDDSGAPAIVYSRPGQFDQAYAELKKELEHSPNHPLVHELLARIDIQSGRYDRAVAEYHALLLINPGAVTTHLGLADVFRLQGDWNNCVATLERAQRQFPADATLAAQLASALESTGREGEALLQYRHALELRPDDGKLLSRLASLLLNGHGSVDEALRLAERAAQRLPGDPNVLDTLGWAYVKKNRTDGAIQILKPLIDKYPEVLQFRYHLAAALFEKGDRQAARDVLQPAVAGRTTQKGSDKIRELLAQLR